MTTTIEHTPSPTPEQDSTRRGMPFYWAMAFAFLIFVAMCVAFWCGHGFTLTAMEKSISLQQPVARPPQPEPGTAPSRR